MKKIILLAGVALLTACSSSEEIMSSDVPQTVISAFNAKYPGAEDVDWEIEKEDGHLVFEAEFKYDGDRKEASYRSDGTQVDD